MDDHKERYEKLLVDAADCELIAKLATEQTKRETFSRLACRLKQMAEELASDIRRLQS